MPAGHWGSDRRDRPGEDSQSVVLRVLAHFVPGDRVLDFLASESDWLDVRWCAEDDDIGFHRELPEADVIGAEANCRRLHDGQPVAHVVNQPTGC